MRKRTISKCAFCVACMVALVFLSLSACSAIPSENKLSEMEDNELIRYIVDSGVPVPENMEVETIREMVIELEEDADHSPPVVGWTVLADLYEDLRNVVKIYYSTGP